MKNRSSYLIDYRFPVFFTALLYHQVFIFVARDMCLLTIHGNHAMGEILPEGAFLFVCTCFFQIYTHFSLVFVLFNQMNAVAWKSEWCFINNFNLLCILTQGPLKKWTEHSPELHLLKIHRRGSSYYTPGWMGIDFLDHELL